MKKIILLFIGFLFMINGFSQHPGTDRDSIRIYVVEKKGDSVIGGEIGDDREYFYHDNGRVYKYFRSYQTALYHYLGKRYEKPDFKRKRYARNKRGAAKDTCFIGHYRTTNKPKYFIKSKDKKGVGTITY